MTPLCNPLGRVPNGAQADSSRAVIQSAAGPLASAVSAELEPYPLEPGLAERAPEGDDPRSFRSRASTA